MFVQTDARWFFSLAMQCPKPAASPSCLWASGLRSPVANASALEPCNQKYASNGPQPQPLELATGELSSLLKRPLGGAPLSEGSDRRGTSSGRVAVCFPGQFLRGAAPRRSLWPRFGSPSKVFDAFVVTSTSHFEPWRHNDSAGECRVPVHVRRLCGDLRHVGFAACFAKASPYNRALYEAKARSLQLTTDAYKGVDPVRVASHMSTVQACARLVLREEGARGHAYAVHAVMRLDLLDGTEPEGGDAWPPLAALLARAPQRPPLALELPDRSLVGRVGANGSRSTPAALYALRRGEAPHAVEDWFYVGERAAIWPLAALYDNLGKLAPTQWHVHPEHMLSDYFQLLVPAKRLCPGLGIWFGKNAQLG